MRAAVRVGNSAALCCCSRENSESAARMRRYCEVPARSRRPLPSASLRPASRVTVHAAGGPVLQIRCGVDVPASCPVLPLRDGLRFAHFPALGRSPCSLFNRREQGELYAGGAASLQERSLSTRMVLLATTLLPIPAISIAEFPFHPAVEQGGRETVRRGDNAADRRPSRSGRTGHDADISGVILICKIAHVRGMTRDPRSRPEIRGRTPAELLARCSAELSPHPRMRIPYSPAPPVRGCSDTNAVSGGGTPPESAASGS